MGSVWFIGIRQAAYSLATSQAAKRLVYKNEEKLWPGSIPSRDLSMVAVANQEKVGVMKTDGTGYRKIFCNDPKAIFPQTGYR